MSTPDDGTPLLQVEVIHLRFGGMKALSGVSLQVPVGRRPDDKLRDEPDVQRFCLGYAEGGQEVAGSFAAVRVMESQPVFAPEDDTTPEFVARAWPALADMRGARGFANATEALQVIFAPPKA